MEFSIRSATDGKPLPFLASLPTISMSFASKRAIWIEEQKI